MGKPEQVQLSFANWPRDFGDLSPAVLRNRYFEQNPSVGGGTALLARSGTSPLVTTGSGNIRAMFSLPGLFDGALFVVSGDTMYRVDADLTVTPIVGNVLGLEAVSFAGVAGAGYQRLFVADGTLLQFYSGGVQATAILTGTAPATDGDILQVGTTYYQWKTVVGSGIGTVGDPFDVLIGASLAEDLANMVKAFSFTGISGTDYSPELAGQNTLVTVTSDATTLTITARTDLVAGNSIASISSSANLTFPAATLLGGGTHGLSGCAVPDGLPPVSLATLKSHVIVALGNTDRFYWVNPGDITIDALSFATAESQPDDVLSVQTVGDTLMFVGENTTEVWYPTGNPDAPFAPVAGRVYDRGAIAGSVVNVNGTVFLVGTDNIVYSIGGQAQRVSTHAIEETIRKHLEN